MCREGIPRARCSNRERSISHGRAVSCGNSQRGRVCRPQPSTTRYFRIHIRIRMHNSYFVKISICCENKSQNYNSSMFILTRTRVLVLVLLDLYGKKIALEIKSNFFKQNYIKLMIMAAYLYN